MSEFQVLEFSCCLLELFCNSIISEYYELWLDVFNLMCHSLDFSLFQRLMAGDDAANKSILNEITILVSFYYIFIVFSVVLGKFNIGVNRSCHRLCMLKSLALIFKVCHLKSVVILSILYHPCSCIVYYYIFGVLLSSAGKLLFSSFLVLKDNFEHT